MNDEHPPVDPNRLSVEQAAKLLSAAAKVRAGAHFVVTGNVLEGDGSALLLQEFSSAVHGAVG